MQYLVHISQANLMRCWTATRSENGPGVLASKIEEAGGSPGRGPDPQLSTDITRRLQCASDPPLHIWQVGVTREFTVIQLQQRIPAHRQCSRV